jgi:tripartite-type tricarboxylate transporter receptor subunit TctC
MPKLWQPFCLFLTLVWLAFASAHAADFPNRSITVVLPFSAGGVTDTIARVVFDRVSRTVGQNIIIDPRPGAGGTIAVGQVAASPPDGYTLAMADPTGALPANVTLYPTLKYHPLQNLAPVAILGRTSAILIASRNLPVKSAQELVAFAKSKPGELTFPSTGVGSPGHLYGELFCHMVGIKAVHVPYRITSQAVSDFVAGRLSFWVALVPTLMPSIQADKVQALAIAANERYYELPDLPTVKETGIADFDASTTYAAFAPAGTHKEVIDRLYLEIKAALEDADVQQRLRDVGVLPRIGTPQEITRMIETGIPQWADVIKSVGIRVD